MPANVGVPGLTCLKPDKSDAGADDVQSWYDDVAVAHAHTQKHAAKSGLKSAGLNSCCQD